jgi:hypothetical protein
VTPRALALLVALAPGIAGCGYTLANTPDDGGLGPLTVRAEEAQTPDGAALAAAIEGAQRELARGGLLSARGGGATLTISLLRVEERSEGIAVGSAAGSAAASSAAPLARGIRVTLVGRAVARGAGGAPSRDSGEVTVSEVFARPDGAAAATATAIAILGRDEAALRAGRRLGARLVRRVLGEPEPDG